MPERRRRALDVLKNSVKRPALPADAGDHAADPASGRGSSVVTAALYHDGYRTSTHDSLAEVFQKLREATAE